MDTTSIDYRENSFRGENVIEDYRGDSYVKQECDGKIIKSIKHAMVQSLNSEHLVQPALLYPIGVLYHK